MLFNKKNFRLLEPLKTVKNCVVYRPVTKIASALMQSVQYITVYEFFDDSEHKLQYRLHTAKAFHILSKTAGGDVA